jgi:hypothetical protein
MAENRSVKAHTGNPAWQKGVSANPNGRPKGAISKKAEQWAMLMEAMATGLTERFHEYMLELEPKDYIRVYLELLNYYKPKLSSVDSRNINTNLEALVLQINGDNIPSFPSNVSDRDDGIQDAEIVQE